MEVSYSCMDNVSRIIKGHNKRVSSNSLSQTTPCNCRNKTECPMNGNCRVRSVIYKFTVSPTTNGTKRVYLGVEEGDWKQRFYNHKK